MRHTIIHTAQIGQYGVLYPHKLFEVPVNAILFERPVCKLYSPSGLMPVRLSSAFATATGLIPVAWIKEDHESILNTSD